MNLHNCAKIGHTDYALNKSTLSENRRNKCVLNRVTYLFIYFLPEVLIKIKTRRADVE